MASIDAIETS